MKFLLDTDTFSEMVRGRTHILAEQLALHATSDLAVSVITVGEVRFGLAAESLPASLAVRAEGMLAGITCLPIDAAVAARYGQLRAHLRRMGTRIGPNDHWIAAHALASGLTLVTGNTREFSRVPGLKLENWLR